MVAPTPVDRSYFSIGERFKGLDLNGAASIEHFHEIFQTQKTVSRFFSIYAMILSTIYFLHNPPLFSTKNSSLKDTLSLFLLTCVFPLQLRSLSHNLSTPSPTQEIEKRLTAYMKIQLAKKVQETKQLRTYCIVDLDSNKQNALSSYAEESSNVLLYLYDTTMRPSFLVLKGTETRVWGLLSTEPWTHVKEFTDPTVYRSIKKTKCSSLEIPAGISLVFSSLSLIFTYRKFVQRTKRLQNRSFSLFEKSVPLFISLCSFLFSLCTLKYAVHSSSHHRKRVACFLEKTLEKRTWRVYEQEKNDYAVYIKDEEGNFISHEDLNEYTAQSLSADCDVRWDTTWLQWL